MSCKSLLCIWWPRDIAYMSYMLIISHKTAGMPFFQNETDRFCRFFKAKLANFAVFSKENGINVLFTYGSPPRSLRAGL